MSSDTAARVVNGSAADEYWFDEGCFITEWLNDPADPSVSVARARVPAGTTTHWHALRAITERYLVLSGRGLVEVAGLPASELAAGDSVRIPPQAAQRVTAVGPEDLVFLAICTPRFVPQAYYRIDTEN